VVSRAQLVGLGLSVARVDRWVRAGRLHVMHRGVYALGHRALRVEGRRLGRTLLDLAASVRPDRLERALAQAERLQLYDHRAIADVLERAKGHRGRAALARAVRGEPKLTRSELEAKFLGLVRRAGLPEPDANTSLDAPDHPGLEVDFYWPAQRLVVETDGWTPTRPGPGSRATAARTPPSHRSASASCASPTTTSSTTPTPS
jgi:hypothetical protein